MAGDQVFHRMALLAAVRLERVPAMLMGAHPPVKFQWVLAPTTQGARRQLRIHCAPSSPRNTWRKPARATACQAEPGEGVCEMPRKWPVNRCSTAWLYSLLHA